MEKTKRIRADKPKFLIKEIAELIDYPMYQIEDVLKGFETVMFRKLARGEEITLWKFGSIKPKYIAPRLAKKNAFVKEGAAVKVMSEPKMSAKLKVSPLLVKFLTEKMKDKEIKDV